MKQKILHIIPLIVLIFLFSESFVQANAISSTSSGGNWSAAGTWNGGVVPGSGDDVTITNGATVTVNGAYSCKSITIQGGSSSNITTLQINGGSGYSLNVSGNVTFGVATSGTHYFVIQITGSGGTLTVGGNVYMNSNSNSWQDLFLRNGTNPGIVTISGNITGTGQTTIEGTSGTGIDGTLNIGGSISGVTLHAAASTSIVNYNGTSASQTVYNTTYTTLKSNNPVGVTLGAATTITTLTIGDVTANSVFSDGGYVITPGTNSVLNISNSGKYQLGSATVGTGWPAWGTRTISAGTTVEYAAGVSQTVSATPTYSNLTISGSGAKTLSQATTVNGILTLTSGILTTTSTNLLSVTNTSSTAITGGSTTSFINGPVKWTLLSNLASGSTYTFPVGQGTTYLPFALVNPTTGTGAVTAQVQAYAANSGGTYDASLSSISNAEYWSLITTGNFSNSSVSLMRQTAISPLNAIGSSTTVNGSYTSLAGTAGTYGVSTSNAIGSYRYFVLAQKIMWTITTGTITGSPFCAGDAVSVPFAITGTFTPGNDFTAQLSDATGVFGSTPPTLGSLQSINAGTIDGIIPTAITTGTGYRIRVVSSTPSVTGVQNTTDLTANALPIASATKTDISCFGTSTGQIVVTVSGGSGSYNYSKNDGSDYQSSNTFSGLPAGDYQIRVKDMNTQCKSKKINP